MNRWLALVLFIVAAFATSAIGGLATASSVSTWSVRGERDAVRALILQSAVAHQQELGRISFKGAVDLLRQWLPQAAACHDRPRKLERWHDELLEAIASVRNTLRPGHTEPRALNRRPKNLLAAHLATACLP